MSTVAKVAFRVVLILNKQTVHLKEHATVVVVPTWPDTVVKIKGELSVSDVMRRGHIASRCPQNQGNEKGVAIAPVATLRK